MPPSAPISAGDVITSEAQVTRIQWTATGKVVEVKAIYRRIDQPMMRVLSRFMYRGVFSKTGLYVERRRPLPRRSS
jgi:hypothetical protein